jgi:hypothetical protein
MGVYSKTIRPYFPKTIIMTDRYCYEDNFPSFLTLFISPHRIILVEKIELTYYTTKHVASLQYLMPSSLKSLTDIDDLTSLCTIEHELCYLQHN